MPLELRARETIDIERLDTQIDPPEQTRVQIRNERRAVLCRRDGRNLDVRMAEQDEQFQRGVTRGAENRDFDRTGQRSPPLDSYSD